jgi:hypothetical protein
MFNNSTHPPIVFISYSHDSQEHSDRVLELSDHLRADGIDCILDQYEDSPPEGFPRWMDRQIRTADFVLMICTQTYYRRTMGEEEPGKGNGVAWESTLIYQYIYNVGTSNTRFIPVLLEGVHEADIPVPWQGVKNYRPYTATGYEELYRRLTSQPLVPKPSLGALRQLPPRERKNDLIDTAPEINVLCCYSHQDKSLRDKLEVALRNLKKQIRITTWNDLEIDFRGRVKYKDEVYLHSADVILLLISSNFLATDFSYNHLMKQAMEKQEAREALVIPLILSPADWEYTPFASFQALPQDGKPIMAWANLDEAFLNIALGIRRAYSQLIINRPTRDEIPQNIDFRIQQGDITLFDADVVALKYAQEFYGLDKFIARRLAQIGISNEKLRPDVGDYRYVNTHDCIRPHNAIFVGVPRLRNFDYNAIQQFSARVLYTLAKEAPQTKHIVMTLHGINAGFDEIDAFLAQFYGYLEALQNEQYPPYLEKITIVDKDIFRVQRLRQALNKDLEHATYTYKLGTEWTYRLDIKRLMSTPFDEQKSNSIKLNKKESIALKYKPYIFVAMPFSKDMDDTFYFGIQGPVHRAGFLCERVDQKAFIGDVLEQVKMKIDTAAAVIAELSDANPNVYLELGYAWGKKRPTILLARNDQDLCFDVRGQKCLKYERILDLEKCLKKELAGLKAQNIFDHRIGDNDPI